MKRIAHCISRVGQLMKRFSYRVFVALAVSAIFVNSADATDIGLPSFSHNGRGDFGTGEVDVEVIFNSFSTDAYNVLVDLSLIYRENATWEIEVTPALGTVEVVYDKDIRNFSGKSWSLFTVEAIGAEDIFPLVVPPGPIAPPGPIKENHRLVYDVGAVGGLGEVFDIRYAVVPASPYSLHLTPIPVPEPSSVVLAALALGLLAHGRCRHRA